MKRLICKGAVLTGAIAGLTLPLVISGTDHAALGANDATVKQVSEVGEALAASVLTQPQNPCGRGWRWCGNDCEGNPLCRKSIEVCCVGKSCGGEEAGIAFTCCRVRETCSSGVIDGNPYARCNVYPIAP